MASPLLKGPVIPDDADDSMLLAQQGIDVSIPVPSGCVDHSPLPSSLSPAHDAITSAPVPVSPLCEEVSPSFSADVSIPAPHTCEEAFPSSSADVSIPVVEDSVSIPVVGSPATTIPNPIPSPADNVCGPPSYILPLGSHGHSMSSPSTVTDGTFVSAPPPSRSPPKWRPDNSRYANRKHVSIRAPLEKRNIYHKTTEERGVGIRLTRESRPAQRRAPDPGDWLRDLCANANYSFRWK